MRGGALKTEEINKLENNKYFKDAVRLRKWEYRGKVSLKEVEELDTYKEMIIVERLAQPFNWPLIIGAYSDWLENFL